MTQIKQVYRCNSCGNIVAVLHSGAGELVCCGQPMQLLEANSVDAAQEKHVPVIKAENGRTVVSIGSEPHPMTEEHYIEWIELWLDGVVHRQILKPGDKPEAQFSVMGDKMTARAYCNLHGLWQSA